MRAVNERPLDELIAEQIERPLSRRTLLKRGRDLGLTMAATSFLAGCGTTVANRVTRNPSGAGDASPEIPMTLVMVIIDAGRPDYLGSGYGNFPNFQNLLGSGTFYKHAWVGQLEAATPASHATIGSGCHPSNDGGILGFWWQDPYTGQSFNAVNPKSENDPNSLATILANNNTPSMAEYIKRHDHRAKVYTASGQKFYAADAVGGQHADYISYFKGDQANQSWGPTCMPGQEIPAKILDNRRYTLPFSVVDAPDGSGLGKEDALVGAMALEVIKREKPRIVILNLPEMDWPVAHRAGGPEDPGSVSKLMKNADRILGELMHHYESEGLMNNTYFMVLGDHGVTPLQRLMDQYQLQDALGGAAVVTHDSNTCYVGWMEDASMAKSAAAGVMNYFGGPGQAPISGVYYLTSKHGRKTYAPTDDTAANSPAAHVRAMRYLLQTIAGDNAPHVVVFYSERTGTYGSGGAYPWHGDHGGASWGSQAIPLIISGPGVRRGYVSPYPARLVDLAPTAMRLLGAYYPQTDGVVLADCMISSHSVDKQRQTRAGRVLGPMTAAIRAKSAQEVRDAGLGPLKISNVTIPGTHTTPGYN